MSACVSGHHTQIVTSGALFTTRCHYARAFGAHDADLAELVGRTNVHIFLVPR